MGEAGEGGAGEAEGEADGTNEGGMWQPGALWRKKSSVRRRARNSARKTTRNGSVWLDDSSSRDALGAGVDDPAREAASTALSPSFKTLFGLRTSSASSSSRRTDLFARVLPRLIACPSRISIWRMTAMEPRRHTALAACTIPIPRGNPSIPSLRNIATCTVRPRPEDRSDDRGPSMCRTLKQSLVLQKRSCHLSYIPQSQRVRTKLGLGVRPTRIVITGMYLRPRTDAEHTFMRMRLTITAGASAPDRDPIVVSTHSPNPRTETRTFTQFTVMLRSCPAQSTSHGSKQAMHVRHPIHNPTTPERRALRERPAAVPPIRS
ncbi:hypothetical protein K466DRAFT_337301 [Polyporus arcularius HHB13444]|uniref:Uncharacterized protein n=1 Tax=Polyporus arcularius HHB13444 TaxID=1314778 RepID=A0A5C3NY48_9APHY|nr:hypothetical protein K466DRAFT_337301 [Polyporus arcularius HHB13444]